MAVYPGIDLTDEEVALLVDYTTRIGMHLGVRGLMNIQYVIMPGRSGNSEVYVLEVNPRSSRTVPFLSKVTGVPMVRLAVGISLGKTLHDQGYEGGLWPAQPLVAVKAPVFSMSKLSGVDTYLGPEMKSTGEVMGIDTTFERAFAKSQIAAGLTLPNSGTVFISVRDVDKEKIVAPARRLIDMGFKIVATGGTATYLQEQGVPITRVNKVYEGRPHIVDAMKDGSIDLVFNTTEGAQALKDSLSIRRTALMQKIPYYTTVAGSQAAVQAIAALRTTTLDVAPLQAFAR